MAIDMQYIYILRKLRARLMVLLGEIDNEAGGVSEIKVKTQQARELFQAPEISRLYNKE